MTSEANTIEVTKPFDQSVIQSVELASGEVVDQMLKTAHDTFKHRDGWLEHHERIAILKKLATLVEQEADEFALLIAKEGGKPLVDAKIEVARAIDGIHLAAKELSHVMRGEEIPMGHTAASVGRRAYTFYEPIGVVVAISAFNHPLNLIVHQVVPAIAVGCPVIVKPSTSTPLNCIRLVELAYQAGLPEAWAQVCVCDNANAEKLVTSDKIGFFSFIGSAKVGWYLKSKLAPGVRCALEHGGVAPLIVDKAANIELAVPAITKGGFYHAGQVCVSVQRVYLDDAIAETIVPKLVEAAKGLTVGDPALIETDVGPLIMPHEIERVHEWVSEAIEQGAECLLGGEKLSDTTYAPTILLNPPADSKVSTHEIFGPVICLYTYSDIDKAIESANSLDVAFQAAVFTESMAIANHCIKHIDATAVMINDHTAFRVDWMPFAGRRHSGYGIGGIGYTMHDMVQPKMVVMNQV